MKIIEDITYSIDDIIDQIQDTFGFVYTEDTDHSGYIVFGSGLRLEIEFDEEEKRLSKAILKLPSNEIDFTSGESVADIYSASIESSSQVIDLIVRMLGEKGRSTND